MRYFIGIMIGLSVGIIYAASALAQKYTVLKADHSKPLMKQLIKSPLWLMSVVVSGAFILVLMVVGQSFIGPTLIPGLSAIGMIIIPIGATRFIGEKNGLKEYLGIGVIIIGVFLLSISKLSIDTSLVPWMEPAFFSKTLWYFGGLSCVAVLALILGLTQKRRPFLRAILFSLSGGFLYGLSNILLAPMTYHASVFTQYGIEQVNLPYLIISSVYLLLINAYAVSITQKAYALGHVSILIPIQQIPIQIVPIISHFWFFQGVFPSTFSRVSVPIAVLLILIGAAALGNKSE